MQIKSILPIAFSLFAVPLSAQKYVVSGSAPEGVTTVYLQNPQHRTADSCKVEGGEFRFEGDAKGQIFGYVMSNQDRRTGVILEGEVTVDLAAGISKGSNETEAFSLWTRKTDAPGERLKPIMEEYNAYRKKGQEPPEELVLKTQIAYEETMGEIVKLVKQCCQENRTMRFPAALIAQYYTMMEKNEIIALAEEGNPRYMEPDIVSRLKGALEGWKRQTPGLMFTDLEMNDTDGKAHKLSEYVGQGKYVLVDFWASWCGPCRREMPAVKKIYDNYKDKGFDIVGLSLDEDKTAWTGAIKSLNLPWHHLSDLKGWKSDAAALYGINSIPATILVGPDGKIVASGLRAEELEKKMAELLK